MNIVFLDTETTGLNVEDGHRIVDVAAVRCVDRKVEGHFQCYLNPEREMDSGAARVHGLTDEFLADKPTFAEKADELIEFIRDKPVYMHNAQFDEGFLDMELRKIGRPPLGELAEKIVDTLALARRNFPGGGNSLDRLCERFGIDTSERDFHGALLDAKLLAEVYLAMTRGQISLGNRDVTDVREDGVALVEVSRSLDTYAVRVISADGEEARAHDEWMRALAAARGGAGA